MRKALLFGMVAVAGGTGLVMLALAIAPVVRAQGRIDDERVRDRRVIVLDGRGSSIGVSIRDLDAGEAQTSGAGAGGAVIDNVEDNGPAAKAGIREGDIVVEFDGERVRSARHFARLVQETPEGRTVKATVFRSGARQTVDLTPGHGTRATRDLMLPGFGKDIEREIERGMRALPKHFAFDFNWNEGFPGTAVSPRGRLGAQLTPLTDQLATYFGAKDGVLVTSVDSDSAASKAGLKAGDVITTINGRSVGDPRDVSQELRDAEAGKEVEIGVLRDKKAMTLKAQMPQQRKPSSPRYVRPA